MKRKYISFYYTTVLVFLQVFWGCSTVFAGVNDFYFESFDADYYLGRDEEGLSRLKVVEEVTAVFPNFNQNKGICRQIPFTNQDGANITLPSFTRDDVRVFRNGENEPIYSIEQENNYYNLCTGDEGYVLGRQVYRFEYEFSKVVTEFDNHQELYWDTNGNGSLQRFDKVTARLHFEDPQVFSGKSWCYVGKFGKSGQDRCEISEISNGVEFVAFNLALGESLTFDVEILKGSFMVPLATEDYTYVWLFVVILGLCLIFVGFEVKKYFSLRENEIYYKKIFVKPEYQPHSKYGLPEMADLYLGKKKDMKVGMLLEMVVTKKIELLKEDKKKWGILVKSLDGLGEEYLDLLAILNGGMKPKNGDKIEAKRKNVGNDLIIAKKVLMENEIFEKLKQHELVNDEYRIGNKVGLTWVVVVVALLMTMIIGFFIVGAEGALSLDGIFGRRMVFKNEFYPAALITVFISSLIFGIFNNKIEKFKGYTKKGLEASRYMDGLKLYIGMAEAERMKMLQSVKGADVSPEGIVKLYEKLLPYAAVFGLEESWMNEMKEYCEIQEIKEPNYLLTGLAISEISQSLHSASSYATTSTVMTSSGGGSSSSFSGGGGGGFAGGGGGGGGFSGR